MEFFVFVSACIMVFAGAIGVVTRSHPVHAALSLVLTLFGVAVMFVAQAAHFLAAVQVIVYAGAIVVLFLFVIMLLGVDRVEDLEMEPISSQRPLALVASLGLVGILVAGIVSAREALTARGGGLAPTVVEDPDANIRELARSVFSDHVFAFELTSVLLVVAVVGTVVMTRRRTGDGAGR